MKMSYFPVSMLRFHVEFRIQVPCQVPGSGSNDEWLRLRPLRAVTRFQVPVRFRFHNLAWNPDRRIYYGLVRVAARAYRPGLLAYFELG